MIDFDINLDLVIDVINQIVLFSFVALIGAGLFGLIRRLRLYFAAQEVVPVLLKRDVVLLGALALIGLEAFTLRALGIVVADLEDGARLVYTLQSDIIIFLAVLYWVKVELLDVDDPGVK